VLTTGLSLTGLKVSRLCFGAMTFGGQTSEATGIRMVERCLDAGINFFDTANVYQQGASETILGNALKGRRHRVVLASKVRGRMGDAPDQSGLSPAAIRRAIDESLQRLQTDYLDLYYLHQPDYAVPVEATLECMEQLIKAGKIRHVACSNYASWQICKMLWAADKAGFAPVRVAQPMYNVLARGIEQEFLPFAKELNVATVCYNPLAGGLLTGKHEKEAPIRGSRFDKNQMYLNRYWHTQDFDAVEAVREASRQAGRSMVSIALNWLLHHTSITCVILGASKLEHLEENLAAAQEGALNPETVAALDQIWTGLRGVTPNYSR
jgi:aryl-alcohol dehydrogenase-like predicted oxidoreductase